MVESLNYSHDHEELSNSQKRAIITLIEQKDKDMRVIANWRPTSLINVDVKIASKASAKRLEAVLPSVTHQNQSAYVKDKTICDAVRSIEDILNYTKRYQIEGRLISIDLKKACFVLCLLFILENFLDNGFRHFITIYQAVF